ncbi:MAG TPA: dienelactone hydrolase family protein [Nitrospiria bacterium]|nr:dienelactone hydrolase family protein [Nitrospiria bacterium]
MMLLLFCVVPPATAQEFARTQLDQSPRHHEWVKIPSGGRTVQAFVAYPETAKKTSVVIVIHENQGLTDWVRSAADQLAAAGYLAIAPDLLSGFDALHHQTSDFAGADQARKAIYDLNPDQIIRDLLSVQQYVAALPAADGRTAVIGFCWGGGQAFRFATAAPGLSAALVFYGPAPTDDASLRKISAPVYGFYGGLDERIDATIPKTREQMTRLGKRYEAVIYDGAGHAFMREGDDPAAPAAVRKARDAAWARAKTILRTVIKSDHGN